MIILSKGISDYPDLLKSSMHYKIHHIYDYNNNNNNININNVEQKFNKVLKTYKISLKSIY